MKIENCWKLLTRTKVCHLDSLGRKLCIWSFIFVPYLCHHGKKSTVTAPLGCLCRTAPTHGTARKCNGLCENFCEKKNIWLHFNMPLHLSTNCTFFSLGTSFSSSCNSHLDNSSSQCSRINDVTFGFNTVFDGSWSQTSNEATECRVATCRNTAPKSSEKSSWRNLKLQKLGKVMVNEHGQSWMTDFFALFFLTLSFSTRCQELTILEMCKILQDDARFKSMTYILVKLQNISISYV